ncbi:MAG: hypothetical protein U0350_39980 [Caldilineaceae bacterium]
MALLTNIAPTYAGATFAAVAAAAGGDTFVNNGKTLFYVNNGSGASINVTVTPQATPGGLTIAPVVVTVPAGGAKFIGPFDSAYFNNASGQVAITYSAVTTVTVAAVQAGS